MYISFFSGANKKTETQTDHVAAVAPEEGYTISINRASDKKREGLTPPDIVDIDTLFTSLEIQSGDQSFTVLLQEPSQPTLVRKDGEWYFDMGTVEDGVTLPIILAPHVTNRLSIKCGATPAAPPTVTLMDATGMLHLSSGAASQSSQSI